MNHFYYKIPGWFGFHDVYDRAVALLGRDGAHFVEVGSWLGRSAAYMGVNLVNSGCNARFDCVDSWEDRPREFDVMGDRLTLTAGAPVINGRTVYDKFCDNMAPLAGKIDFCSVRKRSVDAATEYEDGSLDFVFLDASHEMQDIYDDISAWKPKLKPSRGVLAGDDAPWLGVRMALLKHGMGTGMNPLAMSAGSYKSWIYAPVQSRGDWTTLPNATIDIAAHEGSIMAAQEHMRENLGITEHV